MATESNLTLDKTAAKRQERPHWVLDDAPFRAFDTMAEYREWCERNLPAWLGYGRGPATSKPRNHETSPMTAHYCHTCFRTLSSDRDVCTTCERQVAVAATSRVGWVLYGIALALLVMGMLTYNARLSMAGAGIAVIGVLLRLARL